MLPALPTPTSLGARRGLSVGQSADGEDTWWPWAALGSGVLDASRIVKSAKSGFVDSMVQ